MADALIDDLRGFLSEKLRNSASPRGFHLSREELTRWAAGRDDTTAEDAVRLFERLKGTVWRGQYSKGARFGWNTVYITEVL